MSCPVVETSAGEPLISKRPFAVAKWSAWLVSKESPFLWGSMPSYTQIYNILPHFPVVVSLQTAHKKHSVPNIVGRRNKRAEMYAYGQVGSATGGKWAATSPWILHPAPKILSLYSPVVTICTTRFNIHKFYVLPTQFIYVFCVDLRTNSDYFPIQH